eukprot:406358_1
MKFHEANSAVRSTSASSAFGRPTKPEAFCSAVLRARTARAKTTSRATSYRQTGANGSRFSATRSLQLHATSSAARNVSCTRKKISQPRRSLRPLPVVMIMFGRSCPRLYARALLVHVRVRDAQHLANFLVFEDRIRAIEPTSTILGILHDWLYGHQNHSHIYMHLSQWDGLAKDATHSDLAKFYNAVYRELRSWRDVSLLQMATILGLWTRSKPRVIRGGSLVGRMSRPKDRNLSTVDNADPIRHHIAIFLTKPHIYGQHVHYRYLSKLFDLNREETKPPQGEEAVRDQDPGDIIESMGSAEEQEEEEIEMEPIVQSEEEIDEDYAPAAPTETFEPETESAQSSSNQLKIRLRHIPSSPHFPSPRRFACVSVEGATLGKRARANTADEDDHRKRTRRIDEDEEATSSAQPTTSVSQPTFSGSMLPNQQSVSELADWTVLDGKVSLTDSPQRDFFSEQMDQSSESPYGEMGL